MSAAKPWLRLSSLCGSARKGAATAPGHCVPGRRPNGNGYIFFEVLLSVSILLLIMGALTASVNSIRAGLQQALRNEVLAEEWARLVEFLRDDLRRARAVTWHGTAPMAAPRLFLTVRHSGGAEVRYERLERRIERRVLEGGKVTASQRFDGILIAAELKRSPDSAPADPLLERGPGRPGVWDLVALREQETLEISSLPVYLQARLELDSGMGSRGKITSARPVRTLLAGASTRLESLKKGQP